MGKITRVILSDCQQVIVDYLVARKEADHGSSFVSPTTIGTACGEVVHPTQWASEKCLRLVVLGILERSSRGWYKICE